MKTYEVNVVDDISELPELEKKIIKYRDKEGPYEIIREVYLFSVNDISVELIYQGRELRTKKHILNNSVVSKLVGLANLICDNEGLSVAHYPTTGFAKESRTLLTPDIKTKFDPRQQALSQAQIWIETSN